MRRFISDSQDTNDQKPCSALTGRKGSKKVRSGCITCKIRKVKCDETKPHCLRCTKTGRKCDGYLDAATLAIRRRRRRRIAVDPLAHGQAGVAATHAPSGLPAHTAILGPGVPNVLTWESPEEKRSFDFFQHVTAPSLAGDLDAVFWRVLVLQNCHTEPAVRHAVLAISSLHETFLRLSSANPAARNAADGTKSANASSSSTPASETSGLHQQEFALQQYNKAIAYLLDEMSVEDKETWNSAAEPQGRGDGDNRDPTSRRRSSAALQRPVGPLMTCVLFVCIEVMQGKDKEALIHLEQGRHILSQLDREDYVPGSKNGRSRRDPEMAVVKQHLVPLYTRLSMTSFLFGGNPVPIPSSLKVMAADHIPDTFDSIHALRSATHDFLDAVLRFTQRARPTKFPSTSQPSSAAASASASPCLSSSNPAPSASASHSAEGKEDLHLVLATEKRNLTAQLERLRVALSLFHVNSSSMAATVDIGRASAAAAAAGVTNTTPPAATAMNQVNVSTMALLQMHLGIAEIWLATALSRNETAYDAHLATFSSIVSLAATVLDAERHHRPVLSTGGSTVAKQHLHQHQRQPQPTSVFTLETYVIPALYFVATKCRHRLMRHTALTLLTRNRGRRENLWRADVLGAIAARVIQLEETGHPTVKQEEDTEGKSMQQQPQTQQQWLGRDVPVYHDYHDGGASVPDRYQLHPLDLSSPFADAADSFFATTPMAIDDLYTPAPTVPEDHQQAGEDSVTPWATTSYDAHLSSKYNQFSTPSVEKEDGDACGGEVVDWLDSAFFLGMGVDANGAGCVGQNDRTRHCGDDDVDDKEGADQRQEDQGVSSLHLPLATAATDATAGAEPIKLPTSFSSSPSIRPPPPVSGRAYPGAAAAGAGPAYMSLMGSQASAERPFQVPEHMRVHTAVIGPEEAGGRWVTVFRKPNGLDGVWDVKAEFVGVLS